MPNNNLEDSVYIDDDTLYNKKIQPSSKPESNIGIDTNSTLLDNIIEEGVSSRLDFSAIESFTQVSQRRDQIYDLIDAMCQDPTIAAVLETYCEDATETNDSGAIVWSEAEDPEVKKFVDYLLDTMNVDKHIYQWANCMCKYGDVYLRLYRESDYEDDLFGDKSKNKKSKPSSNKGPLQEDINIIAYKEGDKFSHYVEMVPNPAQIFELTKFGKTYAYIESELPIKSTNLNSGAPQSNIGTNTYTFYKKDVNIHEALDYVHGSLEDNSSRTPEEVNIFLPDSKPDSKPLNYKVKRGQSLFYNVFKAWRELQLLENSILLNRVTKSSLVRIIQVEVGDMPKSMVQKHLNGVKSMMEQKAAIDTGNSINEYNNAGPVENNIYVATKDGKGALTVGQVGGEVNVGQLTDVDYYQDRLFGALRVPKQYFGITDDNAGFSGGESLAIISSRYAKMIKRIQNALIQMLTDAINLMCIDKGLHNYVNKFTLRMQSPTTKEEIDRRDNFRENIGISQDIMNIISSEIEDPVSKIKILKALLSKSVSDGDIIQVLQDNIDKLESGEIEPPVTSEESEDEFADAFTGGFDESEPLDLDTAIDNVGEEPEIETTEEEASEEPETILPTPEELNAGDFANNNNEEL